MATTQVSYRRATVRTFFSISSMNVSTFDRYSCWQFTLNQLISVCNITKEFHDENRLYVPIRIRSKKMSNQASLCSRISQIFNCFYFNVNKNMNSVCLFCTISYSHRRLTANGNRHILLFVKILKSLSLMKLIISTGCPRKIDTIKISRFYNRGRTLAKSQWQKRRLIFWLLKSYISFWLTLSIFEKFEFSIPWFETPFPHPFYD